MTTSLTVTLTFESDWLVASGDPRGVLADAAAALDHDGLPYVPAATLVGLLRERGETVVGALEASTGNPGWRRWHQWLFGSDPVRESRDASADYRAPVPAALTGSPLRLPSAVRAEIARFPAEAGDRGWGVPVRDDVRAAARLLRPGVEIDEQTGTVNEDMLRAEERARADLTVEATDWDLTGSGSQAEADDVWPALLILHCAARLLTTVGGRRRRGAGEIRTLQIGGCWTWAQAETALEAVPGLDLPPLPVVGIPEEASIPRKAGPLVCWADLDIEVRTPVVVAPTVRGNVITSAVHLPGASLIPLLRDLRLPGLGGLLRDGLVRVTPAYPVVHGQRCEPWPQALGRAKHDADESQYRSKLDQDAPELKAPRRSWLLAADRLASGEALRVVVPMVSRTQAVVDDGPDDRDQAPFTYVGLAPGTRWRAQVWVAGDVVGTLPPGLLSGEPVAARIGVARRGDKGAVTVTWSPASSQGAAEPLDPVDRAELVLVAASDWLLTEESGAPCVTDTGVLARLGAALGCTVRAAGPATMRVRRVESWQATWGLPRPSLLVVEMGSVFPVRLSGAAAPGALARLLRNGIGGRRSEGFGLVRLGDHLRPGRFKVEDHDQTGRCCPDDAAVPTCALDSRAAPTWRRLVETAWKTAITDAARVAAQDDPVRPGKTGEHRRCSRSLLPAQASASQLGQLRAVVETVTDASSDQASTWVGSIDTVLRRSEVWAGCRSQLSELLVPSGGWGAHHPVWEWLFRRQRLDLVGLDGVDLETLTRFAVQQLLFEAIRAGGKDVQAKEAGR